MQFGVKRLKVGFILDAFIATKRTSMKGPFYGPLSQANVYSGSFVVFSDGRIGNPLKRRALVNVFGGVSEIR
jgi:hypothetical protein